MSNKQKVWKREYKIKVSGCSRARTDKPTFAEEIFDENLRAILRNYKAMFSRTKVFVNEKEIKHENTI